MLTSRSIGRIAVVLAGARLGTSLVRSDPHRMRLVVDTRRLCRVPWSREIGASLVPLTAARDLACQRLSQLRDLPGRVGKTDFFGCQNGCRALGNAAMHARNYKAKFRRARSVFEGAS